MCLRRRTRIRSCSPSSAARNASSNAGDGGAHLDGRDARIHVALQRSGRLREEPLEPPHGPRYGLPASGPIGALELGIRESPTGRALAHAGSLGSGRNGRLAQERGDEGIVTFGSLGCGHFRSEPASE
jgi:hypothetical protein